MESCKKFWTQLNKRRLVLVLTDMILIYGSMYIALGIRFDFELTFFHQTCRGVFHQTAPGYILWTLGVFCLMGIYKSLWKYASINEMLSILVAALIANGGLYVFYALTGRPFARSGYIINSFVLAALIGGSRFSYRVLRRLRSSQWNPWQQKRKQGRRQILIIGAGEAGYMTSREMLTADQAYRQVVGFLDDNPKKTGRKINGIPVLGTISDLGQIAEAYGVEEAIIAIPSLSPQRKKEILQSCNAAGLKMKILPSLYQIIDGKVDIKQIREVAIEDLLGRPPVKLNNLDIRQYIEAQVVLVTGAGGSIGSELCRQIAKYKPQSLILFDIYENSTYDIQNELLRRYPDLKLEVLIGSVRDIERLEQVFKSYEPHIVFHAAAHKHVPLMEYSPMEAIKNNSFGTYNTARMAGKYGVKRFVLISTDKAVNPTNIMGASKRLAEIAIQQLNREYEGTDFVAVRFGNVLGSNGSVIPLFKMQIAMGGPVTVTHPDIIRYFMTIPEAVQLVLQAGAMAKGGEIFILDMGDPVKIVNLAEDLIRLSGFEPYTEIPIRFTGLRPGEKLYEELLLAEEGLEETLHEKIYIGKPLFIPAEVIYQCFQGMRLALETEDISLLQAQVKELVPGYGQPQTQEKCI